MLLSRAETSFFYCGWGFLSGVVVGCGYNFHRSNFFGAFNGINVYFVSDPYQWGGWGRHRKRDRSPPVISATAVRLRPLGLPAVSVALRIPLFLPFLVFRFDSCSSIDSVPWSGFFNCDLSSKLFITF